MQASEWHSVPRAILVVAAAVVAGEIAPLTPGNRLVQPDQ